MATEEWIKRAILGGKTYDDLPSRVKNVLSQNEYKARYATSLRHDTTRQPEALKLHEMFSRASRLPHQRHLVLLAQPTLSQHF